MMRKTLAVLCVASALSATPCFAQQDSKYDFVTNAQALAAKDALNNLNFDVLVKGNNGANVDMYTNEQMDYMLENQQLRAVVEKQDQCQFVPDIEDRARLVNIPVFQFAWGEMLVTGVCVKKDAKLGVDYIKKAAENSYAPAMERMSFYYEKGFFVQKDLIKSERYMHTAAALGSISGRLGWADMLVRGYGSPQLYEEAFSWLYHSEFKDPYSLNKKNFLQAELEKRMPPNVIARNKVFEYEL
ncbi:MAG: flagellar protein MotX [Succinivibrio sp.]|nr:flagellar protein MotX [Succinivibrio sp.]